MLPLSSRAVLLQGLPKGGLVPPQKVRIVCVNCHSSEDLVVSSVHVVPCRECNELAVDRKDKTKLKEIIKNYSR